MNNTLINRADAPAARFLFAHGAGAGKDSDFMQYYAKTLSQHHIEVMRFDFPYMQTMIETGKRRPPDRAPKLLEYFTQLIEQQDDDLPLFIGGKSMGGRIASMLLEQTKALGCICMGYPFHPPGKLDKLRIEHLQSMTKPLLIIQGERDTFGTQQQISQYPLSNQIQLAYLPDGDHSFKPRKASGVTLEQNLAQGVKQVLAFIQHKDRR